jgi:hypothetical protein
MDVILNKFRAAVDASVDGSDVFFPRLMIDQHYMDFIRWVIASSENMSCGLGFYQLKKWVGVRFRMDNLIISAVDDVEMLDEIHSLFIEHKLTFKIGVLEMWCVKSLDVLKWFLKHNDEEEAHPIDIVSTSGCFIHDEYEEPLDRIYDYLKCETNLSAITLWYPMSSSAWIQPQTVRNKKYLMEKLWNDRGSIQFPSTSSDIINGIDDDDPWMIQWIWDRKDELPFDYTEVAMNNASIRGKINFLQWWYDHRNELKLLYTAKAIDYQFITSDVSSCQVLDWWYDHSHYLPMKYTQKAIELASSNNLKVLNWWLSHWETLELIYDASSMDEAKDAAILDAWFDHKDHIPLKYTTNAFLGKSINVMKWWINHSNLIELKYDPDMIRIRIKKYLLVCDPTMMAFYYENRYAFQPTLQMEHITDIIMDQEVIAKVTLAYEKYLLCSPWAILQKFFD